jgi:predicted MFS family arabinose efflux permease
MKARNDPAMDSRLLVLCFGNFVIGTGTLIVPGMLPGLAQGLGVTVPVAAQLITAFALTVCLTAPVLAALTARFDRRRLLVGVLLLFAAGHLASAFSSVMHELLVLRVLSSIGAALFTAQAASAAALLVPVERRGSAIAFVFLGWSIASVMGMPLGAYISETLGWQAGFLMVGAGSLVAACAVQLTIPSGLKVARVSREMWGDLMRNRRVLLAVGVTAIQSAAQFTLLSFLVPSLKELFRAGPEAVSLLLVVLGVTGVAGNVLGARLIDRIGSARVTLYGLVSMLAAHVLWVFAPGSWILLVAVLVLWGLGCLTTNGSQQARLVHLSPPHAPVSVALNSSAIYLGQAGGTAAGAAMLATFAGPSTYTALAAISIPLFIVSIALSLAIDRKRTP